MTQMPKANRRSSRRSKAIGKLLTAIHNPAMRFCVWHSLSARNLAFPIHLVHSAEICVISRSHARGISIKQLSNTLDEIKSQGLYKTERIITGPQNAKIAIADGRRVINHVREQLSRPGRSSRAHRGGERSARHPRLRHGERAFHLRHAGHPQGTGGRADEISRDRRHDSLSVLLRRERRLVRNIARRGRRRHFATN